MKKKSDFSEEIFLQGLRKQFNYPGLKNTVGIRDDAAILKTGNETLVITADMMAEDVHFDLKYFSIADLAYKIIAVNVSDISAMGGIPLYSLISIAAPKKNARFFLKRFYDELEKVLNLFKIKLIGGDTISSNKII
ncbi:MAG: AIR synthase related protein, partial [bacterium]|nr:AIR synthase related protein [bacterium]